MKSKWQPPRTRRTRNNRVRIPSLILVLIRLLTDLCYKSCGEGFHSYFFFFRKKKVNRYVRWLSSLSRIVRMLYAGKPMVQNICVWTKRFPRLGVAQQANQAIPFSSSPPTLRKFRGAYDVGINVPTSQLAIMTFNESRGLLKA